jgi:subtilisin-like proprotein convertase family protein
VSRARPSALPRILLAALGLGLVLPPAAQAARLPVDAGELRVTEVRTPNGIVEPGDVITLRQSVRSASVGVLSGVTSTLTTTAGAASVLEGESAYPDLAFGGSAANLTPFRVAVARSAECGELLRFGLTLRRGTDDATLPMSVATGAPGPPASRDAAGLPRSVPDQGTVRSSIAVDEAGRLKDVRVRIARLDHGYLGDLRLTLISPAGTRVTLVDDAGGDGADLRGTILASGGLALAGGTAPFTGTFAPVQPLSRLEGEELRGSWTLEVQDDSPGASGALIAWGLDLAPATCEPRPVASFTATPLPVAVDQELTLDASSSSDPTGAITSYAWDLDGDGTFETDDGARSRRTVRFPSRRTVEIGLRITNEHGEISQATRSVAVTAAPMASFTATPDAPASGQEVRLDASASSDPDGSIIAYAWDLDGDGSFEKTSAGPTTTARWDVPGRRTVRVRVTDDNGAASVAGQELVVANRAPRAVLALPRPAVAGRAAVLDAGASTDPDGPISSYAWDLDGLPGFEVSGAGASVTHTWPAAGRHPVRVRVTDGLGASAEASGEVVVTVAPVAALVATPAAVRPGARVMLDASGSADPDGTLVSVDWDLDGDRTFEASSGTVLRREGSFASPGPRTVRVRVTDDSGAWAVASARVDVVNEAPVARLSADVSPVAVGRPVTLDASASSDAEGRPRRLRLGPGRQRDLRDHGPPGPRLTRAFPNPAVIAVGVRVTDEDGATGTATVALAVVPAPGGGTRPGARAGSRAAAGRRGAARARAVRRSGLGARERAAGRQGRPGRRGHGARRRSGPRGPGWGGCHLLRRPDRRPDPEAADRGQGRAGGRLQRRPGGGVHARPRDRGLRRPAPAARPSRAEGPRGPALPGGHAAPAPRRGRTSLGPGAAARAAAPRARRQAHGDRHGARHGHARGRRGPPDAHPHARAAALAAAGRADHEHAQAAAAVLCAQREPAGAVGDEREPVLHARPDVGLVAEPADLQHVGGAAGVHGERHDVARPRADGLAAGQGGLHAPAAPGMGRRQQERRGPRGLGVGHLARGDRPGAQAEQQEGRGEAGRARGAGASRGQTLGRTSMR